MFCRECGLELTEGARYCERCGAPVEASPGSATTPVAGTTPTGPAASGYRSVRGRLPGWVYAAVPSLFVVGLAVGLVIGFFLGSQDGGEEAVVGESTSTVTAAPPTTLAVTSTLAPSTTSLTTTSVAPSTTSATAAPTTTTRPPTTTTWPDYIMEWPSGRSGWTVQVAKFDGANPYSEEWANEKAEEVLADHLPAGILYSSDFSSIQEGWWVVFSGVFSSKSAAQSHRTKVISKGYSEAVVIQVVPR